ncbi:MAG: acyl-CoA dehydrogenase family protein [Pyrodictiaceae archaeon]
MLPESLVRFAREKVPYYASYIDKEGIVPIELMEELKRLGFFAVAVPKEYGGLGLGLKGLIELGMLFAESSIPLASIGIIHAGVAISIMLHGSSELKENVLPRMARGEVIGAVSITEPGGGSDLAANTRTSYSVEGERVTVKGEKIFTSNGIYAGIFLVLARPASSSGREFSLIVVPKTDDVAVEPLELTAFRGAGIARVVYKNATTRRSWMLEGDGFKLALELINYGRLAYAAMGIGASRGLLRATLRHASAHKLFGQNLIEFQGPRWMLATIYSRTSILEEALRRVAERGSPDPLLAAMLKVEASRLAMEAAHIALQLHGGRGLEAHSLTERMLRDTTALAIGEGANEVLLDYISRIMMKRL